MNRIILLLLGLALAGPASADGIARLKDFFDGLKTLKADFTQTVEDAQFSTLRKQQGNLAIQRPGKFYWRYQKPYEQVIIADGKQIWIYDKDLEQVTVKPQGNALGDTPALLLSGGQDLEKRFRLRDLGDYEGLTWVELKPREQKANFQLIRLGFDGKTLRRMDMLDSLDQSTHLTFDHVQRNVPVDESLFEFEPPDGVDVFSADQ